jgi:wobble nucleotide-excising tRNase
MIKKIKELSDIGIFQMLKSSNGTDGDFGKLNVLYAENGCGKSTICDVLRAVGTSDSRYLIGRRRIGGTNAPCLTILMEDGKTIQYRNAEWHFSDGIRPSILVYDDRFVSDNVFVGHQIDIAQKRNLYGVVLGRRARQLQDAVADAEESLSRATQDFNAAQLELKNRIPRGYTIETFKRLGFVENVDGELMSVRQELESKNALKHNIGLIQQHSLLRKYQIPSIPVNFLQALATTLDDIVLDAEQKVQRHLHDHTNNLSVEWVKQGVEKQKDVACPFCGQDTSHSELLRIYAAYFSGELKSLDSVLRNIASQIDTSFGVNAQAAFKNHVEQNMADKAWWHDIAQLNLEIPILDVDSNIQAFQGVLALLQTLIIRKKENIAQSITLSDSENATLSNLMTAFDKIKLVNDKIEEINLQLANYKRDISSLDTSDLEQRIQYLSAVKIRYDANTVSLISRYDNAEHFRNEASLRKSQANRDLKEQSESVFNAYGNKINEILGRFGVPFKIVPDGVNFRGGPPAGQLGLQLNDYNIDCSDRAASNPSEQSLSNTLSGGDRSALALAFFLAIVEGMDDRQDLIIVFDDPYHDQDENRRNYTITLIQEMARHCKQCFVMSHNLEFAYDVEKCKGIESRRSFVIKRYDNPVELKYKKLPQLASLRYILDYKELVSFSQHPTGEPEYLKHVAALIRDVLENYIRHKYPAEWDANSWLGTIVGKIRTAAAGSPLFGMHSVLVDLTALDAYCSRYHHGPEEVSTDVPLVGELKTHVDIALKVIHAT